MHEWIEILRVDLPKQINYKKSDTIMVLKSRACTVDKNLVCSAMFLFYLLYKSFVLNFRNLLILYVMCLQHMFQATLISSLFEND